MSWDLKEKKEGLLEARSKGIFENGKGNENAVSILHIDTPKHMGPSRKCSMLLLQFQC